MVDWTVTTIIDHPPPLIPLPVVMIVAFGFVTSTVLLKTVPFGESVEGAWIIPARDVTNCSLGNNSILLVYRFTLALYTGTLALQQLLVRGPHVYSFFTMWSWLLMVIYFVLASYASIRALRSPHSTRGTVDELGYTVVALFHCLVSTVIVVDTFTWLLLVPMLLSNPDPIAVEKARAIFFSFTSYNTHGANALFALGELLLNCIPFTPYLLGYLGMYSSSFGIWAFTYFRITGKWLYPFLDVSRPHSWLMYAIIYGGHWAIFGVVALVFKGRDLLRGVKDTGSSIPLEDHED